MKNAKNDDIFLPSNTAKKYRGVYYILFAAITFFICAKVLYIEKIDYRSEKKSLGITSEVPTDLITVEENYRQYFSAEKACLGLGVYFAIYLTEPDGIFALKVYEAETGNNVEFQKFENIQDNQISWVHFSKPLTANKKYYFTVVMVEPSNDTVSMWKSEKGVYQQGKLFKDGILVEGDVNFELKIKVNCAPWLLVFWVFLMFAFVYIWKVYEAGRFQRRSVVVVYLFMFLFFILQVGYHLFRSNFGIYDEMAHISYLVYLTRTHKMIPEFKNLMLLAPAEVQDAALRQDAMYSLQQTFGIFEGRMTDTVSYLGHCPLYYLLMLFLKAVKFSGDLVYVELLKLRIFNIVLSLIGMIITCYIGYSRIPKEKLLYHLLYISICVNNFYVAYQAPMITNDNLLRISIPIFLLGFIRILERKYDFKSFLILGAGVSLSVMVKLTMGLFVTVAVALLFLFQIISDRSFRSILNRAFLYSLFLYVIPLAYYGYIFVRYGTVQPSLSKLVPQERFQMYVAFYHPDKIVRESSILKELYTIFFLPFLKSWAKASPGSARFYMQNFIWLLPIYRIIHTVKIKKRGVKVHAEAAYAWGIVILMAVQCYFAWTAWIKTGHPGNQARYYAPLISFMALDLICQFRRFEEKVKHGNLITVVSICAVNYFGFMYTFC